MRPVLYDKAVLVNFTVLLNTGITFDQNVKGMPLKRYMKPFTKHGRIYHIKRQKV